jgi:hypothetical protein
MSLFISPVDSDELLQSPVDSGNLLQSPVDSGTTSQKPSGFSQTFYQAEWILAKAEWILAKAEWILANLLSCFKWQVLNNGQLESTFYLVSSGKS